MRGKRSREGSGRLTAAVKAKVHMVQNLEQELGKRANCSLTDLRMVEAARYEATKEWA